MEARTVSVTFAPNLEAPRRARRLIREQFLPPDGHSDLELLVSELVTNAVRHGRGDVRVTLATRGDEILGEVVDEGSGFAGHVRDRGVEAVSGRGLKIVAQLATRWGVNDGSSHVWFEIN